MREKANIAISITDVQLTDLDRELFVPVMKLDHFISVQSRQDLGSLEEESGIVIHSLDNLVKAMQMVMEKYRANGAVGIKSALAYQRTLQYDKVSRHEAETAFNRISSHLGEGLS